MLQGVTLVTPEAATCGTYSTSTVYQMTSATHMPVVVSR